MANKADNKAAREAANKALSVKFPMTAMRQAFDKMAGKVGEEEAAKEDKAKAAHGLVVSICDWRDKCKAKGHAGEDILNEFNASVGLLQKELGAKKEHRFIKKTVSEKDGTVSYALTGYGNNVLSIARGCIQQNVAITKEMDSYAKVRDAVIAARARGATPTEKERKRAKDVLAEAVKDARKAAGNDIQKLRFLAELLRAQIADWKEKETPVGQADAQEVEAEADRRAEAEEKERKAA